MSSQDTQSNSNGYILSDIEELVRAWKEDGNWDSLENGEKEFWSLLSNYSNEEIPDFVSNLSFHQVEGSTYSNDYGTVHLPSGTVVHLNTGEFTVFLESDDNEEDGEDKGNDNDTCY